MTATAMADELDITLPAEQGVERRQVVRMDQEVDIVDGARSMAAQETPLDVLALENVEERGQLRGSATARSAVEAPSTTGSAARQDKVGQPTGQVGSATSPRGPAIATSG